MLAIQTYVANQQILAAELNTIQFRTMGKRAGDLNNEFPSYGASDTTGPDSIVWMYTAGIATGTLLALDQGDWRDRYLLVMAALPAGGSNDMPGNVNDINFQGTAGIGYWYSGLGAYSALGPPVVVSNGAPPISSAGASWRLDLIANLYLYVEPADGILKLYNDTGAPVIPFFDIRCSAKLAKR